jgi:hypothetical protein
MDFTAGLLAATADARNSANANIRRVELLSTGFEGA